MPVFFEKFIFRLGAFSYSIKMGLSLTKLLMSPQKKLVSSAKFTILISWSPVCAPWIPCHYHWNGWNVSLRNCITWILSLITVNYWIYSLWHEISKYFKIKSPLLYIYNRYEYCFKAGTHSHKFFHEIINIYNLG